MILGPTATGKSHCAIALAKKFGGEIISGDSMLVYRQMDIGTAKPSKEELETVPHHLVNIFRLDFILSYWLYLLWISRNDKLTILTLKENKRHSYNVYH